MTGTGAERVLLLNPAVFDTRLPWARWLQPTTLLKLATLYKQAGRDVKLVDAMWCERGERPRRARQAILPVDDLQVNKWRFGMPVGALKTHLRALANSDWTPDLVVVEGFTTFWWEGVAEAARLAREVWRDVRVAAVGPYAALAADHARSVAGVDEVLTLSAERLAAAETDLTLYPKTPGFAYVALGERPVEAVVAEIQQKAAGRKVRHVAFLDHRPTVGTGTTFRGVLEQLAGLRLKVSFYALGNIAAAALVAEPALASLLKQAGFTQLCFADDRDVALGDIAAAEQWLDAHRSAAELCGAAGFAPRTDNVSASVSIGRPGEDLAERTALVTRLTHAVGSVVVWPYQPLPRECPEMPLELQNGKLFPFRACLGI